MSNSFITEQDLTEAIKKLNESKEKVLFVNNNQTNENEYQIRPTIDEKHSSVLTNKTIIIKEMKYRWIIFTCFVLLSFSNGVQWVTFSAIAAGFSKTFNIDSKIVDLYGLSYMYCFPLVFPIAAYIIDNKSVKYGLIFSAVFNICGGIMKVFTSSNLTLSIIGQFMNSLAQPFIISSSGKIASIWFRADMRALITSLLSMSNIIGSLVGIVFNTLFFSETIESKESYEKELFYYLLAEAILVIVFSLPTIFLFKSKPKHAPSISENNHITPSFTNSLKMLIKNKSFMLLFLVFTIIVGFFNMMGTILNQFLGTYSINTLETSIIGAIGNVLGIIGCVVSSIIIDKTRKYKPMFIIFITIALVSQVILTVFAEYIHGKASFYVWMITCSAIFLSAVPCYAIGIDYVCEITYPVGEIVSGGFILAGSNILGIGEIYLADYFMSIDKSMYVNVMSLVLFCIAFICILFLKEELLRDKEEHKQPIDNNIEGGDISDENDHIEEVENEKNKEKLINNEL